jgi:hypothetical protein
VKIARRKNLQSALELGAKHAELDFPGILTAIEARATLGQCTWSSESPKPMSSTDWHDYCRGFRDRVNELIGDSDFSVMLMGGSGSSVNCRLNIEW